MDKPEEFKKKEMHPLLQDGLVQTQHADIFPQPEWYVMNDTLIKYNRKFKLLPRSYWYFIWFCCLWFF